jgi:serine/threonine-protein kinase
MAGAVKEGAAAKQSRTPAQGLGTGGAESAPAVSRSIGAGSLGAGQVIEFGREAARYEIVRSLGRGGMAEVFLARSLGDAGLVSEVALKCITPDLEVDERIRKAFVHEAQLAIRLRHPNIVDAYQLFEVGDRCYLVLEYIEGVSLKTVLRAARREQKKLSTGFCCYVAASVAEGLAYAHGRTDAGGEPLGIVHRDVKPANVMIADSGAVKLLDFGIAFARVEGRDRTQTGKVKGTYAYLSPEQASRLPLDGRSDLFSLGLVLVEMLTGARPFDGGSDLETVQRIGECAATDVAAAIRGLPTGLREICEKALAKRPDDRFRHGAEFSRALRDYLAEERVLYWPSDCVAEARGLGVFAGATSPGRKGAAFAAQPSEAVSARVVHRGGPVRAAEGEERSQARAGMRRRWLAAGVALCVAALAGTVVVLRHGSAGPRTAATDHVQALATAGGVAETARAESIPVAVQTAALAAPSPSPPVVAEPVVRPKRKTTVSRAAPKARDDAKRSGDHLLKRADVTSSTLPRGTLVRAKLVAPVDAARPGTVEAVVAENVISGGVVLVPAGSVLACNSRASKEGRVPVSCDSIRAADRRWSFSGLAVGEGQHVGLRVVDTVVPAGSSFVVYVDAEFR